jgi:hypothetical protein
MKYRKPIPASPPLPAQRRFLDTSRLSPGKAALVYITLGLVIGIILFGGSFLLWREVAADRLADVQDAQTQFGVATVAYKQGSFSRTGLNHMRAQIGLRINGHVATTETEDEWRFTGVHLGDRVSVQYRVGKSGDITIDSWQDPGH